MWQLECMASASRLAQAGSAASHSEAKRSLREILKSRYCQFGAAHPWFGKVRSMIECRRYHIYPLKQQSYADGNLDVSLDDPFDVFFTGTLEDPMPRLNDLLPVTDLRHDAAKVLKRVQGSHEPVVVTQRGRAAAVILSVEAYETGEQERELLRLLARGEADIRARAGDRMEAVLAQADVILKKV